MALGAPLQPIPGAPLHPPLGIELGEPLHPPLGNELGEPLHPPLGIEYRTGAATGTIVVTRVTTVSGT